MVSRRIVMQAIKEALTKTRRVTCHGAQHCLQAYLMFSFAACFVLLAQPAHAHWCDTSTQTKPIERAICSDAGLRNKDIELNDLYFALGGSQNNDLKLGQRSWLKARNSCTTMECLQVFYDDRLRVLRAMAGVDITPEEIPPSEVSEDPASPPPSPFEPDDFPDIEPF